MADDLIDYLLPQISDLSKEDTVNCMSKMQCVFPFRFLSSVTKSVLGLVRVGGIFLLIHTKELTVAWITRPG